MREEREKSGKPARGGGGVKSAWAADGKQAQRGAPLGPRAAQRLRSDCGAGGADDAQTRDDGAHALEVPTLPDSSRMKTRSTGAWHTD